MDGRRKIAKNPASSDTRKITAALNDALPLKEEDFVFVSSPDLQAKPKKQLRRRDAAAPSELSPRSTLIEATQERRADNPHSLAQRPLPPSDPRTPHPSPSLPKAGRVGQELFDMQGGDLSSSGTAVPRYVAPSPTNIVLTQADEPRPEDDESCLTRLFSCRFGC